MSAIVIPERKILVPPLTFPRWLKRRERAMLMPQIPTGGIHGGINAGAVGVANAAVSSLLTNLVAYWALSDLSDASGNGHTLTNNASVTFGAGKLGNAAYLTNAANQGLSLTTITLADNTAW